MRNLKKNNSKIQTRIDAEKIKRQDITESEESENESEKSDVDNDSAITKTDKKAQNDQSQVHEVNPFPKAEE